MVYCILIFLFSILPLSSAILRPIVCDNFLLKQILQSNPALYIELHHVKNPEDQFSHVAAIVVAET